jgi:hypothetical protein
LIPDIKEFSTGRHFQNGRHNTAQIQHCPISTHLTMLNIYRPFFMPCFGSHFQNGRHLENFESTELLL